MSEAGIRPTPKTSPTATATPKPSAHALAWIQGGQVWASINDGQPRQISHGQGQFTSGCAFGAPVFSPDLTHLAIVSRDNCGGGVGPDFGRVLLLTVASGAATTVPLPNGDLAFIATRSVGWVDNSTIWILGRFGTYEYALGTAAAVALPNFEGPQQFVSVALDAVVRGHTLYYTRTEGSGAIKPFAVHIYTYDLATKTPGTVSFDAGAYTACLCAPSAYPSLPGWDVSPDGSRVVWQYETPSGDTTNGGTKSAVIKVASGDGTVIGSIPLPATLNVWASWLRISPDGQRFALVAGTNLVATHATLLVDCTDPATAGGTSCRQSYVSPVAQYPAWSPDSSGVYAGEETLDYLFPDKLIIMRYAASTQSTQQYATNAYSIWSTP